MNYSTDEYVPDAFDGQKFLLKTINADDLDQMYAAYIFPSYMAGRFGDAFIGEIWTDCSVDGANALQAIENRLSGAGLELKEAWKEFALMNYDDAKEYGRKYKEVLNTWNCHAEDTILLKVSQIGGAACHTGFRSCFFTKIEKGALIEDGIRVFDPKEVYKK